jgi:hypothetical protein
MTTSYTRLASAAGKKPVPSAWIRAGHDLRATLPPTSDIRNDPF